MDSIIADLRRRAAGDGGKALVRFVGGESFTAADVLAQASRFAALLQHRGIQPGDRVAIMLENRPEFLWAYYGTVYAGAVPAPLNTALRGAILEHMVERIEPSLVVLETATAEACLDAVGAATITPVIYAADGPSDRVGVGDLRAELAIASVGEEIEREVGDLATILFTSGTTGPSKGTMYSHGMAIEFGEFARWLFGYGPDDVMFNCLPLFHANALMLTMVGTIRSGGTAVLGSRFSAGSFWNEVRSEGATIISLLGSMIPILWNQPPSELDRQHKARIGLAVPTPRENFEAFEKRFGLSLTTLYGLSDAAMPIGVPFGTPARAGRAGVVHPDWEVQLVDAAGVPVPPGTAGELLLRPRRPHIMQLGYWRQQDATIAAWRDLWFHSGDTLSCDEEGWYTFIDRTKDAIRRSGENVSSFEVELVLQGCPGVAEIAVYAVPAELAEDEVMAAVVVDDDWVSEADLVRYAEQHLPYFAVPRYVRVLDEMPKTATAKIRKEILRATGVDGETHDAGPRGRKARAAN